MMNRRVKTDLIERWISENNPFGIEQLTTRAKVAASTINDARKGKAPKKPITRQALASALGFTEDELFPLVDRSRKASSSGNVAS